MANTRIWYWPKTDGAAVQIDFGATIKNRAGPYMSFVRDGSQGLAGDISQVTYLGFERIRLEHRWGGYAADKRRLRRDLEGLLAHLETGGWCALAEDSQYAFAALSSYNAAGSPVILTTETNVFRRLLLVQPDLAGREIVYQSDPENFRKEHFLCSSHVDGISVNIVDGGNGARRLDYSDAQFTWLREAGSYPCLRIPLDSRGAEHLRHDRERIFYLDLPLETDVTQLRAWYSAGTPYPGTTGGGPVATDLVNPGRPQLGKGGPASPTTPWYASLPSGRR